MRKLFSANHLQWLEEGRPATCITSSYCVAWRATCSFHKPAFCTAELVCDLLTGTRPALFTALCEFTVEPSDFRAFTPINVSVGLIGFCYECNVTVMYSCTLFFLTLQVAPILADRYSWRPGYRISRRHCQPCVQLRKQPVIYDWSSFIISTLADTAQRSAGLTARGADEESGDASCFRSGLPASLSDEEKVFFAT